MRCNKIPSTSSIHAPPAASKVIQILWFKTQLLAGRGPGVTSHVREDEQQGRTNGGEARAVLTWRAAGLLDRFPILT